MIKVTNGGNNSINSKNTNLDRKAIHIHGRIKHNRAKYAKYYSYGRTKFLGSSEFTREINHNRIDFLDIGKQMLEASYTLNLGQLLKITPELKRYLWQQLKLEKIQNVKKVTIE